MKKIPLRGKYKGMFAIVDDDDYDRLSCLKWYGHQSGKLIYVANVQKGKTILMHRDILGSEKGLDTDHINGNPLDNRKKNLRRCSRQQNLWNRRYDTGKSKFRGVCHKGNRWIAQITKDGKTIRVGSFLEEKDAAIAWNKAAEEFYGEYAYVNNVGA
jgi:hypothetical protein